MRAELDVTPEIDLTPKTAFKLTYAHHIACAHIGKGVDDHFKKAHAVIARALEQGIITKEESEEFYADCLNERAKYLDEKFKTSDDVRTLMGICTAEFQK